MIDFKEMVKVDDPMSVDGIIRKYGVMMPFVVELVDDKPAYYAVSCYTDFLNKKGYMALNLRTGQLGFIPASEERYRWIANQ